MTTRRRFFALAAAVLTLPGAAAADGFHEPPFKGTPPPEWEKRVRERLRLEPARPRQRTGEAPKPAPAPDAPKLPPLTTEELGPVVVHLIDLLRYLDPRNINPTEFPEVGNQIGAYRAAVKRLLADLGERGVGYLVEALAQEIRQRRRGEGRRIPPELLGLRRADRNTWGTSGDSEMEAAPEYVDDLVEIMRTIGWVALRECLRRQAIDADEEVRTDLARFTLETCRRLPRLFLPALVETASADVRREGCATLVAYLREPGRLKDDRDLSTRTVEALVADLRALEGPTRERAAAGLLGLLARDFGRDQTAWLAYWGSTVPILCGGGAGIPETIERLALADPTARGWAAKALREATHEDFDRTDVWWSQAPEADRVKLLPRWRAWWTANRERLLGK